MASGRGTSVRTKLGALFMLVGLMTGTFSVFGPRAIAAPVDTGSDVANFEIDDVLTPPKKPGDPDVLKPAANLVVDQAGKVDWAGLADLASRVTFDDNLLNPDPNLPGDDGYQGSSKEFDRSTWTCQAGAGATPGKDNIQYMFAYPALSISEAFVSMGFIRESSEGNTNVVVELNQNPIDSCENVEDRTIGDLALHFDFPGGDDPAGLEAYLWTGSGYESFDLPDEVANGATNAAVLALPTAVANLVTPKGLPSSLAARTFGEVAIDLNELQQAVEDADLPPTQILDCPGVGFANIRTRSSGSSDQSALHDNFPQIPFDLSDCASLKIKKVDDLGDPMEGISFALYASEADRIAGNPAQLPTDPPQDLVCTTAADGVCSFPKVPAGDYILDEVDLPEGYSADPDLPKAIHLDPFQDLDLSDDDNDACASDINGETCEWFVNTLRTGTVEITKAVIDGGGDPLTLSDTTYLDGIAFELQDDQGNTVQKRGGGDATCALDLDEATDEPSCTITDVPFGTYDVVEDATTLPAGLSAGPSVEVVVSEDSPAVAEVTYENPADPLNISIDKTGPDTANVGDTITYTFTVGLGDLPFDTTDDVDLQPLTSVAVTEVILAPDYANRCTASALAITDKDGPGDLGDDWLEEGERWTYQCTHVVTAAEAFDSDGTALKNRGHVTGTDRYDRTDTAEDDHTVTILLPDLQVVKQAADGVDEGTAPSSSETIDAPGTASYTITVTNIGAGIARNATLTDTLPSGSWTVTLASPDGDDVCPVGGGNTRSGSFSCNFGDLAPNASKTITVSRSVTIASDCAAVLTNNAGVATTYQQVDIDPNGANDTSSATINVRCPDVGVVKTATNTPVSAGERAEWTITLTNHGAGVANDVNLEDTIDADLGDLVLGGTDADDCALDGHELTCDFGDLAGAATRTITVSGLTDAADCGTVPNTATIVDGEGDDYVDTNLENNEDGDDVVVQCPDVYVDKSGPAEVTAGDDITWQITFGNSGDGDAFNAVLTDVLPTGLTYQALSAEDDAICDLAGNTVTCAFEVLESGAEHTISVTGTTGVTSAACGNVVNPVSIAADNEATDEETQANNTDSVTTDVECPDVDLVKVAEDPSTVSAGDDVGFTITVSNASGEDVGIARNVTIDDVLPAIAGYTWEISPAEELCALAEDGRTLHCDVGDLDPGASFSVTLVASLDTEVAPEDACGTYLNTATVGLDNGTEDDDTNNSASVSILCPGVNLTKVADAPIVEAGDDIGFTITVTNLDDGEAPPEGTATNVVVEDQLPGDLVWEVAADSDLPDGANCSIDSENLLTCNLGDLPAVSGPEGIPQVTIHVVADTTPADCAVYDNTATATVDNGVDPDPADATSRVRCPIDIDLDKTGDTLAHVGDVVDYDFTVTNTGGEDLFEIDLTDVECDAGTIQLVDDGDGDDVLAAGTWDAEAEAFEGGEVWAYTCQRTLTEADVVVIDDEDFALNTGSVRGEDEDGREATDTDPHVVEIITPVIEVVKTVDDATPGVGQSVTFTYVVTNTGDTTLFDVAVVDDQLGAIGTIAELAPGASSTLTKSMVVAVNSPTRNVATATGSDVLGKTVTDDDDATITIVLAEVLKPQPPVVAPQALPRTGADTDRLLLVSGLFLLLGGLLMASGQNVVLFTERRRRR